MRRVPGCADGAAGPGVEFIAAESPDTLPRPDDRDEWVGEHASCHLTLPAVPVRRAERELLDLPGRCPRDRLPELDGGRRLVAGEPLLAERDDLRLGSGSALGEHHQRLDRLTPL